MLSGLVYAAVGQVSNRFQLCASVATATRKLHAPSTPVGTTIGRVLNTMASGKYEPGPPNSFDLSEATRPAQDRTGIKQKSPAVIAWGFHLHENLSTEDLHRVLVGMR